MSAKPTMVSIALRDALVERLPMVGLTPDEMARVAEYLQGTCKSPASAKRRRSRLAARIGVERAGATLLSLTDFGVLVDTENGYVLDPRLAVGANRKNKVQAVPSSFKVRSVQIPAAEHVLPPLSGPSAGAMHALAEERLDAWVRSPRAKRARLLPLTPRELSYEIWGDEKMLDDAALRHRGPNPTFSPVFSPDFMDREGGSVLVIENLDPYLTLCDVFMQTGVGRLCGTGISAVLYRGGTGFDSPSHLCDWLSRTCLAGREVLYWGDIDRAGIHDLNRYSSCEGLNVRPFIRMYARMVSKQSRKFRQGMPPARASERQPFDGDDVSALDALPRDLRDKVVPILGHGCMIPQEILTFTDYLTCIGWPAAIRWLLMGPTPLHNDERTPHE